MELNDDEYIDVKEAAERFPYSQYRLRELANTGEIKHVRRGSGKQGRIAFHPSWIRDYIDKKATQSLEKADIIKAAINAKNQVVQEVK